jgi:GTPase SAR1 family protein
MGLGCIVREEKTSMPVLNMIVVGYPNAGKTQLISRLGSNREEGEKTQYSLNKMELDIGSFVLENRLKMVTFEVSSAAVKSWKYYYPTAHVLLIVVDAFRLQKD